MGEISAIKTREEIPEKDKWTIDEMFPEDGLFEATLAKALKQAEDFTSFHSLFLDPNGFVRNMNESLVKQGEIFNTLFSDRVDKFFSMLEHSMKAYYLENSPSNLSLLKTDFILVGVIHTFKEMQLNRNYDMDLMIHELEDIIRAVSVYSGQ